jgi:hypothetical protein
MLLHVHPTTEPKKQSTKPDKQVQQEPIWLSTMQDEERQQKREAMKSQISLLFCYKRKKIKNVTNLVC